VTAAPARIRGLRWPRIATSPGRPHLVARYVRARG
jgi:hypothetical protein